MGKIKDDEPCPCGSNITFGECHGEKLKQEPETTQHIRLRVIPEPDPGTRAVFQKTTGGTLIIVGANTTDSLDCGFCGLPLAAGFAADHLGGLVLQCASCGAFNDTLD